MTYPELSRGDKGADVRRLQELLDRVGAMLVCDGDFGGMTERGVRHAQSLAGHPETGTADDPLWIWLDARPEPFPPLPTEGVALIAREETGGLAYFDAVTRWPHCPGLSSGITIGIGYDLRSKTEPERIDELLALAGCLRMPPRSPRRRDSGAAPGSPPPPVAGPGTGDPESRALLRRQPVIRASADA